MMNAKKALKKCFLSNSTLWSDFLDGKEELDILYYPSAGMDMMPFAMSSRISTQENLNFRTPNLFIYTDYFACTDSSFLEYGYFGSSNYVDVRILDFCKLTINENYYKINYNKDYLDFDPPIESGNILFLKVHVMSRTGEPFDTHLLYLMHENVNFIEQFLLKFNINVKAIMWKRDGTGLGGGRLYHSFILQLLNKLKTKWLFVWDFYLIGQELELDFKNFTIEQIPQEVLPYIRTKWSIKAKKICHFEYPNEDKVNFYKLDNTSLSNSDQKPKPKNEKLQESRQSN